MKITPLIAAAIAPLILLDGCSKTEQPAYAAQEQNTTTIEMPTESDNNAKIETNELRPQFEIVIDGMHGVFGQRERLPGVRRRFIEGRSGIYNVEYVHSPYGTEKDETLDYSLTLNYDNTYYMSVTSHGVKYDRNGHWYERQSKIIFYIDDTDEKSDEMKYNEIRGEFLPHGKIMLYENRHTVVLNKQHEIMTLEM